MELRRFTLAKQGCKQRGYGVPGEREPGKNQVFGLSHIVNSVWAQGLPLKRSQKLMTLSEQKNAETKDCCQTREVTIVKISIIKTPSSVLIVKISLKSSTIRIS